MSLEIGPGITFGPGVRYDPIPVVVTAGLQLYLDAQSYVGMGDVWTSNLGSDATLEGSPLSTYTAASPTYFNFDPSGHQYGIAPNSIGDLSRWTVEAWFRPQADLSLGISDALTAVVTTAYWIPEQGLTGQINYCLTNYNGSGGHINGISVGFFNGGWHLTVPLATTPGTWYQVVGTYDGSTMQQYNNGAYSNYVSTSGPTSSANGGDILIARRWDGDSGNPIYEFPGDIGIVRIYNRVLSSGEISKNYNANRGRYGI